MARKIISDLCSVWRMENAKWRLSKGRGGACSTTLYEGSGPAKMTGRGEPPSEAPRPVHGPAAPVAAFPRNVPDFPAPVAASLTVT